MPDYFGSGGRRPGESGARAPQATPAITPQQPQPGVGDAGAVRDNAATDTGSAPGTAQSLLPALTVPKGGGAIRGIGEKFQVNAATGTASLSVPIAASPGRNGFGPAVGLAYDSGAGNGPFGLGFTLSVPQITRKTDKGLPRYLDEAESDEFILAGAEDLVPVRDAQGDIVELSRTEDGVTYRVRRYRPRVEAAFSRIERWIKVLPADPSDGDSHWRVTSRDNITSICGQNPSARITDPSFPAQGRNARIFSWLLEQTHDDKGNIVRYEYKPEDGAGVDRTRLSEKNRFENGDFVATAQRYLKRALYCNAAPFVAGDFLMELVFDYGEHTPASTTPAAVPGPEEDPASPWSVRPDPFSTYRATFEIRTYRLCRRVLMFHRFDAPVAGVRPALLVRSTDFEYEPSGVVTYLTGVTQAGYLNDASTGGQWQRQVLPTLRLDYTRAVLHDELRSLPKESLDGLEGGVDGGRKQWLDLDGEGIPGVLIDSDYAWYYKENRGDGKLTAPRALKSMPSPASLASGVQQLEDVGGDGQLDLVAYGEPLQGYFTRTTEGDFAPLRPFQSLPNIDFNDPNLRFIDLDGDGLPDLLISEDHAFVWYRSKGKQGFEAAQRIFNSSDDNNAPSVVFADPEQTIQLADVSGDGLVDIVRIRNGEVSYWPNLGYGRFGKKITLENGPRFDTPDHFDARRVRFADVDGSGTSDLFYLGRSVTTLFRNESGNRLAAGEPIHSLPPADNVTSVGIVDLLGTGTACLMWSSPLPSTTNIYFVDLMGGIKPHLLETVTNNLGAETTITYAPSTKFYLEDKAAGIPWLTRLPFPVQVVERMERFDHISKSKLVSTYRYRHGFFDGVEREFRGFARVEQRDAEDFADPGQDPLLYQPPVRTVSWFHTGAWLEKERLELALQSEYFQGGPPPLLVKDTILPPGMSIQDEREAARALRGSLLRTEVYADDGSDKETLPYVITEQNQEVRLIQKSLGENRHGVFLAHGRETVTVTSERNLTDPRVAHEIVLDVDEFGAVTRRASVVYGRATGEPEQQRSYVTLAEADFVHQHDQADVYRIATEVESRAYEVTGLSPMPAAGAGLLDITTLRTALDALNPVNDLDFDEVPSSGVQRRLLDRKQQTFYTDDLSAEAALGTIGLRALPHTTYQLALTAGDVALLVSESQALTGTAFNPALLVSEGKYVERSGEYWAVSGRAVFSATEFYLPVSALDPFGNASSVTWDDFKLLPTSTTDPLGNLVTSENDYRILQPRLVTDPNLNRSEVAFDALGMVIATAVMGKVGGGEGDTIADPTTRLDYDLLRFQTQQKPTFVHTFARAQHGAANPRFQETFAYSDGFGRITMQKVQAEPGDVPGVGHVAERWVGTGRVVFNNKGNPVKQYEPYFSATSEFEDEDDIVATGVTPILHYDSIDRLVRTERPDGSESRVEFDSWMQRTFDPNDAIAGTRWLSEHQAGSADEQRAAALALEHAETPTITHLDSLGRAFLVQVDNGPEPSTPGGPHRLYDTRTGLDIKGNTLSITDARGVVVIQQRFDVLQRRLRVDSPDAGVRLGVTDVAGKPLRAWDSRSQTTRSRYDALQRATHLYVAQGATERLLLRSVFGEALNPPVAQAQNLRGHPYLSFDCAGLVTTGSFDFKGNLLSSSRRVAIDYTAEPNWIAAEDLTDPAAVLAAVSALLETEQFDSSSTYDALNRVVTHTTPDSSVTRLEYNEANLLEALFASVRGAAEQQVISDIDYNARGQRTLCAYANGTITTYEYDSETFRLTELETLRGSTKLQHLLYIYDAVGNIVALRDQADTAPIFSGTTPVSGDGLYEYDPLYRLLSATGREHPVSQPVDIDPPLGTGVPHANDLQALIAYSESYVYDQVGNIEQMAHVAGPSGSSGWTRNYQYATDSNRLLRTSVPGSPLDLSETYTYDPHGSMTNMPHLAVMDWDYADRLQHTQKGSGGGGQHTYFTYDASGQRVRKVALSSGVIKERIYLGGYEVYRERAAAPGAPIDFERQTLHLMDDQRRVAMAETKTREAGVAVPSPISRWRFQLDNHLGSAMLELDAAGAVISYEEYHPYGSTAFHTADGAAEVSAKRYRYSGKEKDDETGLYYHGARYYAPWLGRWTASDPAGLIDGPNSYYYVRDNPIRMNDPEGRQSTAPALDPETVKVARTALERAAQAWGGRPGVIPGGAPAATPAAGAGSAAAAGAALVYAAAFVTANVLALHLHMQRSASIARYTNPYGLPSQDAAFPVLKYTQQQRERDIARPFPEPVELAAPQTDAERARRKKEPVLGRIYVTYTKFNAKTGLTYSGRTSAVINLLLPWEAQARAAVAARDANHHVDEGQEPEDLGFGPAVLDEHAVGLAVNYEERYRDVAYHAIRGREQQLVDYHGAKRAKELGITDFKGGARTDAPPGVRLTENKDRPVAKENVLGEFFHAASNLKFGGEIAPFTGDRRFGK